ncbi:LPS assembly lipoprotein LptE [Cerasicoccus maritimus]|uniref:LPS assembly lipoprotein LptE n=1 Tax=Cerasicoccus maritimus TaxID=490089 RepID=UPI002852D32E|nr:LPS assembly lipoprotein LptE [Cerasicoccus maritimus]
MQLRNNAMRLLALVPALLCLWLAAGCANYQLGDNVELPFKTVYVEPIVNKSFAPQAEVTLANQLIADLNKSGQVKIADKGADTTLKVVLIDYQKGVAATQANDTQVARAFTLMLTAQVTLTNNKTGEVYIQKRELMATQQAFTNGGFIQSEYQAMPVLTRSLAEKIANQVLGAW